jgi:hypothetical protein
LSLFKGIAVVIDDELDEKQSGIATICSQIQAAGGYVVGLKDLPAKDADLANFSGASFFLVDWDLLGGQVGASEGSGVAVPEALKENKVEEILDFLDRLKLNRYVPVFIFTNADVESVKTSLAKRGGLYQAGQPSHIFVKSKDEVVNDGVLKVLNDWVATVPSAFVLKHWELEYERAKNALFADFYANSVYWPVVLWEAFEDDGVPGSDELGRLISRNLLSRMTPFDMDMKEFATKLKDQRDHDPERYRQDLLKVLEGERFVRNDRLHDERVATGDVFKFSGNYFLNVRPDCDCIPRSGTDDPDLYLLKGSALRPKAIDEQLKRDRGLFSERDDEAIVFALHEQRTVSFKLKEIRIKKWSEVKDKRVGRLLPPFLTRVQQRYAAYLQRPGIPKIPTAAMPLAVAAAAVATATASSLSLITGDTLSGPDPQGSEEIATIAASVPAQDDGAPNPRGAQPAVAPDQTPDSASAADSTPAPNNTNSSGSGSPTNSEGSSGD